MHSSCIAPSVTSQISEIAGGAGQTEWGEIGTS